ncbi:MAG: hypothetical protein KBF88_05185 [Polyangiaceae bacterium]|nr:hypothetical protein [Polyangiaceae bacterium]
MRTWMFGWALTRVAMGADPIAPRVAVIEGDSDPAVDASVREFLSRNSIEIVRTQYDPRQPRVKITVSGPVAVVLVTRPSARDPKTLRTYERRITRDGNDAVFNETVALAVLTMVEAEGERARGGETTKDKSEDAVVVASVAPPGPTSVAPTPEKRIPLFEVGVHSGVQWVRENGAGWTSRLQFGVRPSKRWVLEGSVGYTWTPQIVDRSGRESLGLLPLRAGVSAMVFENDRWALRAGASIGVDAVFFLRERFGAPVAPAALPSPTRFPLMVGATVRGDVHISQAFAGSLSIGLEADLSGSPDTRDQRDDRRAVSPLSSLRPLALLGVNWTP